jgi:hypothetical protein
MRNDTRSGVYFCPLHSTGCATLQEAHHKGWKAIFDGSPFYETVQQANMLWVYDADHMITVKDRHARTGRVEPISDVVSGVPDWRCVSCGAGFESVGGKIVGGTCPEGQPTCPLEPIGYTFPNYPVFASYQARNGGFLSRLWNRLFGHCGGVVSAH